MGNKRRVERLITALVLHVNLAPNPATPHLSFDLGAGGPNAAPAICSIPLIALEARYVHWGDPDELSVLSEEQLVSFLTLFI